MPHVRATLTCTRACAQLAGYLEADINIASSSSAEKMWGLVQAATKAIVVDLALIIEAKETHQLPERLLGAVRMQKINLASV